MYTYRLTFVLKKWFRLFFLKVGFKNLTFKTYFKFLLLQNRKCHFEEDLKWYVENPKTIFFLKWLFHFLFCRYFENTEHFQLKWLLAKNEMIFKMLTQHLTLIIIPSIYISADFASFLHCWLSTMASFKNVCSKVLKIWSKKKGISNSPHVAIPFQFL